MTSFSKILLLISALSSIGASQPTSYQVYVFLSEKCPVSQYYTLPLKTLYQNYASDQIQFIGVFPNRLSTPHTISDFKKKYDLPFPCIPDSNHIYVNRLKAGTTPEVIISDPSDAIIYKGRIDNAFAKLGQRRRVITEHDLQDVLQAIAKNKAISFKQTQAIGCLITPRNTQQD